MNKKDCNPKIGSIPFSTWRKLECSQKLSEAKKAYPKLTFDSIKLFVPTLLSLIELPGDLPCVEHITKLLGRCMNAKPEETTEAIQEIRNKNIFHDLPSLVRPLTFEKQTEFEKKERLTTKVEKPTRKRKVDQDIVKSNSSLFSSPTNEVLLLGMRRRPIGESNPQSSTIRDRRRLEALDKYFEKPVFSYADPGYDIYDKKLHNPYMFGRRGVRGLKTLLGDQKIDLIMADYFRFPATYMYEAYRDLCNTTGTLNSMYEEKVLAPKSVVMLPNPKAIHQYCDIKELNKKKQIWKQSFVDKEENPLAFVTDNMSREDLLGYSNQDEINLLGTPSFMKLSLI